jgi:Mg2+-importing ATPase
MIIPLTSLAPWFGFEKIPFAFYSWMMMIIIIYIVSAELVKQWFYKKLFKMKY